ncbi:MAG: cysteine hydrolase [Chlorobi bacterium]|nr:cysteine hydrolase [Chlorobiota bacterium]
MISPAVSRNTHLVLPKDSTALMLIDIQDFYFPGGTLPLVNPEVAADKASQVLAFFRENKMEVIHVKHAARSFADIYKTVTPHNGEKVFTKTEVNAFLNTGLDQYLRSKNIRYLVICGMQTHMCLEAATRAAHDLGYTCTVLSDACATRDLVYYGKTIIAEDVHLSTLASLDRYYGRVMDVQSFLNAMNGK